MKTLILLGFLLAFPAVAGAQPDSITTQLGASDRTRGATSDDPIGAPYNVGPRGDQSQVPLRDYLSSRIDQLRAEMLDRFVIMERQQREILDERDRQYAQRFAAQQEAVGAALQAAKEAVANALSAAKEAVTKAEDASNKRFDSVNEFREQLRDQAGNFMGKETAEARFKALEDKATNNSARLDAIKERGAGANNLWGWLIGAVGLLLGVLAYTGAFSPKEK